MTNFSILPKNNLDIKTFLTQRNTTLFDIDLGENWLYNNKFDVYSAIN